MDLMDRNDTEEAKRIMRLITERVQSVLENIHEEEIAEFERTDQYLDRIKKIGGKEFAGLIDTNFKEICMTCPVLKTVMSEPTMVACGKTFEKEFILSWFARGHRCCPAHKDVMRHSESISNTAFEVINEKWRRCTTVVDETTCYNITWLMGEIEKKMVNAVNDKLIDVSVETTEKCHLIDQIFNTMGTAPTFRLNVLRHPHFLSSMVELIDKKQQQQHPEIKIIISKILGLAKEYVNEILKNIECEEKESLERMTWLKVFIRHKEILHHVFCNQRTIALLYKRLAVSETYRYRILEIFFEACIHGDPDVITHIRAYEMDGKVIEGVAYGRCNNTIKELATLILRRLEQSAD